MKATLALLALLPLTACVTDQLNSGFARLRGQPISLAMDSLGVPSSERTIAGRHVYTWTNTELVSRYQPTTSYTTGKVPAKSGDARYSGSTIGGTTVQTSATCKIDAEVDEQQRIRNISYDGTIDACAKYAQALNR